MKNVTLTNGLLGVLVLILGAFFPKLHHMSTDIEVIKSNMSQYVPSSELVAKSIYDKDRESILHRITNLEAEAKFRHGNQSGQYPSDTDELWAKFSPTKFIYKAKPINGLP